MELFSGIGGFSKGIEQSGFTIKKHYFSEIDKHAIANYKYNFKNAEYIGSVNDVRSGNIERPNIITFGSPCQDFSLAGKQLGLNGERSVLILEAIRIIREFRPNVFIWENVKGAGFYPKIESGYTLSDILQEEVNQEYFLSEKQMEYITKSNARSQVSLHQL